MPRIFHLVSQVYHPNTGELILSEETIQDALSHKTIKEYAYVLHNLDVYSEEEVKEEKKRLSEYYDDNYAVVEEKTKEEFIQNNTKIVLGEHKPDHWHVIMRCDRNPSVDEVAGWFGIPANYINLPKGAGAFLDNCEYITHESEKEQSKGKYLYTDDLIHSNFDFRAAIDEHVAKRLKYGKRAGKVTDGDIMQLHVMQDGWSMRRCRQEDPLTYIKVRNKLPNLRLDYLLDQPPQPFRISIYVDGPGGLGKGSICQYIGERLFPNVERPCFVVGNDPRVAFDGYDGEPVLIWEDYRAYKFIQNFSREGTFAIFDSHPKVQSQQVKNSRIVLQNYVNIVNGVEQYMDFLNGLAGEYTDRDGNFHESEDKNQAFRRFQQIICIREDDFDVLFNKGFIDKDSHLYQQYDLYSRVRGSMSQAMQRLEGKAKEHVLIDMTNPAVDCYHMIEDSHENKISEVEDLPEEFKHYGEVITPEELWEEAIQQHEDEEVEELLLLREYTEVYLNLWTAYNATEYIAAKDAYLAKENINYDALSSDDRKELEMQVYKFINAKMPTFEEWKDLGCPNAWNKKDGFFRAEK